MQAIKTNVQMQSNMVGSIKGYIASRGNVKPLNCLCEFIDNSLSAGATEIKVVVKRRAMLEVIDNGCGTPNPEKILSPFISDAMDPTSKYGIGAAGSAIMLSGWGKCIAESVTSNGLLSRCLMDWEPYVSKKTGDIEITQIETIEDSGLPCGTALRIETTNTPKKQLVKPFEIIDKLAFLYAAALRKGVRIVLVSDHETNEVKPYEPPKLKHVVRKVIQHKEWGRIEARVGIVAEGLANPYQGFNVYWGKRILVSNEPGPCAMRDASSNRIYGEVFLDHASFPHVNTFKDGFTSEFDQDELWEWLADEFAQVIDKAKSEMDTLQFNVLNKAVQDAIQDIFGFEIGKEKRVKPKESRPGAVEPAESGKKRKTAEKIHDQGDVVKRDNGKGMPLKVKVVSDATIGTVFLIKETSRFWEVAYNPDLIPSEWKKNKTAFAYTIAASVAAKCKINELQNPSGQKTLPFSGDFEEILTRLIGSMRPEKPQPAKAVALA